MQYALDSTQYPSSASTTQAFAKFCAAGSVYIQQENNHRPECGSESGGEEGGLSGLPPPAPLLTFCHTLGGRVSSRPQPNYSATHLTAIKRRAAGVRGSRAGEWLLPWPLSLSRFPEDRKENAESQQNCLLRRSDRRGRAWSRAQNNHRLFWVFFSRGRSGHIHVSLR